MKNQSLILMLSFSALTGSLSINAVETNLNRCEIYGKDQEFKRQWEENSARKGVLEAELRMLLEEQGEEEQGDAIEPPSYLYPQVINGVSAGGSWGWEAPNPLLSYGNHPDVPSDDEKDKDEELRLAIEMPKVEVFDGDQLEEALKLSKYEEEKRREEEEKRREELVEKNKKRVQKEDKRDLVKNILQLCQEAIVLREQHAQMLAERSRSISSSSTFDEIPFEIRYEASSDLRKALELMHLKVKEYFKLVSLKSEDRRPKNEHRHERKKALAENLTDLRLKIGTLREKIKEKEQERDPAFRQYLNAEDGSEQGVRKTWLDLSTEKRDLQSQLQNAEEEEISAIGEYFSFVAGITLPPAKEEKEEDAWPLISVQDEEIKEAKQELDLLVAENPIKTRSEKKASLINTILDVLHPRIIALWKQWKNTTDELSKAESERYTFSYDSQERKSADEKFEGLRTEKERLYSELSDAMNRQKSKVDKYFSLVLEKSSQPKDEERRATKKELRENLQAFRLEVERLRENVRLSSLEEQAAWDNYCPNIGGNSAQTEGLRGTWRNLSDVKNTFQSQLDEALEKESHMIAGYFTFVRNGTIPTV